MMPDLGKYAYAVGWSYAVTLALLGGLLALALWRRARVKRLLAEVEARQGKSDG